MPKSVTLAVSPSYMTFEGLTSWCTRPAAWACPMPRSIWIATSSITGRSRHRPSRTAAVRSPPATHSAKITGYAPTRCT
ncbi:hypothetical protein V2I01_38620 [Micromonospora sp. BRA006-A]|nr:hypothetical protein [Micromonospora sp. BRA006-A]